MEFDLTYEKTYGVPVANSTLLPLLLMSLLEQKNSPRESSTIDTEYDYIVVGAGTAGSVVASRLSEIPCINVLLLEAGKRPPVLTDVPGIYPVVNITDIDWGYQTVPQKYAGRGLINRQIPTPRGKVLGGSSTINGMNYVRGNRKNYDDWAAQGAEGWSWKDVLPYFLKLEDFADFKYLGNGYHSVGGPITVESTTYQGEMEIPLLETAALLGYHVVDHNAETQTGFTRMNFNSRNAQRCSTAKAYLVPAEDRTNLNIVSGAFVKKVVLEQKKATGVIFEYKGVDYNVRAKREVIISAGALNTPQILMLSGIGPKDHLKELNIPVIADLPVGKNLHDHAGAYVPYLIDLERPFSKRISDDENILLYINDRSGPLSSPIAQPIEAFLNGSQPELGTDFPTNQLFFRDTTAENLRPYTGMTNEFYETVYGPYVSSQIYTCTAICLQPRSRGSITLKSSNPHDSPLIDPNYFSDPRDLDEVVEGMKTCQTISLSDPMKILNVRPFETLYPGCEQYSNNEDHYFKCQARAISLHLDHQVGTAKMGRAGDPTTVVDPLLRVKGIQGLRVADASIMPTVPSGNTMVPTIMIGEKASDIIKNTIKCI